jgi:hypothetical protein
MKDKKVPYLIALGIYRKKVIDKLNILSSVMPEEALKGASLLARNLS